MTIKKILAVRNDRFGEFLLIIPALRALKRKFPDAAITLAVNPYVRELAHCIEGIDEVIVWENRNHSLFQALGFVGEIKKSKFGLCVIFNPSKACNIISFLAGIPVRVGYDRKGAAFLTHKMKDVKHLGLKHEVEYNLELASLVGVSTDNKQLSLSVNNDIISGLCSDFGVLKDENLVALHPWTSDPVKQWPLEYFQELALRLTGELGLKVLIVGGREEEALGARLFGAPGKGLVNLTGKTSLTQLAALLRRCRLLISGDSGPVHLASCVGIPVVALFRSDMPEKGSTRWGPRSAKSVVVEKPRLEDITVEEVVAKIRGVLGR